MKNSALNNVFQDAHVVAPTIPPDCATVDPCTESGCFLNDIVHVKTSGAYASFAAPSQQQNSVQAFQAAPSFLC